MGYEVSCSACPTSPETMGEDVMWPHKEGRLSDEVGSRFIATENAKNYGVEVFFRT